MSWLARMRARDAGVYLYRTDKPSGRGRHNAYVGESWHLTYRHQQHVVGGGKYRSAAKDWVDLEPRCHVLLRLPWWLSFKWLLRALETLAIVCTWPVYNVSKNRWNPRRISLWQQAHQRRQRDLARSSLWHLRVRQR